MPGAVRARPGTGARQPARPFEPEPMMTKAKTTTRRRPSDAAKTLSEPFAPDTDATRKRDKAATRHAASIPTAPKTKPTPPANLTETTAATPNPPRQTKAALLRARLAEPGGVSLAALIQATGWQAHTLRAAMSGLRKEGLTLTRRREGEDTIYAMQTVESVAMKTSVEGTEDETVPEATCAALSNGRDAGASDPAPTALAAETNA